MFKSEKRDTVNLSVQIQIHIRIFIDSLRLRSRILDKTRKSLKTSKLHTHAHNKPIGKRRVPLGMEVGLSPGHIVLGGDPAPPPQ